MKKSTAKSTEKRVSSFYYRFWDILVKIFWLTYPALQLGFNQGLEDVPHDAEHPGFLDEVDLLKSQGHGILDEGHQPPGKGIAQPSNLKEQEHVIDSSCMREKPNNSKSVF